jgi:hypothetical protein
MFSTVKSRFVVVSAGAWALGSAIWALSDYNASLGQYLVTVLLGWVAIWLAIYASFWVLEGSAVRVPRWLGYALVVIMIVVLIGLPKLLLLR